MFVHNTKLFTFFALLLFFIISSNFNAERRSIFHNTSTVLLENDTLTDPDIDQIFFIESTFNTIFLVCSFSFKLITVNVGYLVLNAAIFTTGPPAT